VQSTPFVNKAHALRLVVKSLSDEETPYCDVSEPSSTAALAPSPHLRSTRTRVHGCHQAEVGAKGERALGPADGHHLVLHGLAHDLQDASPELGHLVLSLPYCDVTAA
jgi:hypothetical protein